MMQRAVAEKALMLQAGNMCSTAICRPGSMIQEATRRADAICLQEAAQSGQGGKAELP